jgi:adenine-specific DNA-methyltransferase
MVHAGTDPDGDKTVWAYDPHLDPVLNFDSARAGIEKLIDDALASDDPERMRDALQELKRLQAPYLNWTGKAERTSFEVDTVSLHVHERIDPATILANAAKRLKGKDGAAQWQQPDLFAAPFENLPLRQALDFYHHEKGWSNRLVAGDSLLVMNSLLTKESMGGKVQMIYIDPPYGIKYGSNFQPFTNKRDVKDRSDDDLTQEPEMIKAFRDTWELGIHSYLTYLRDRLMLARELLTESGSVFVQISEENVHLVRGLLDEIFGAKNFFADIIFVKAGALGAAQLPRRNDYIIWYAKDRSRAKYHQVFIEKDPEEDIGAYRLIEEPSGKVRGLKSGDDLRKVRPLRHVLMTKPGPGQKYEYEFQGRTVDSGARWWGFPPESMPRLVKSGRIAPSGKDSKRYLDDFPASYLSNLWTDTATGSGMGKVYVVQTNEKVVERCMVMTTDPGDLVLDPTCGSGTTAFVAEKWGRRWITCDTSRVAITLAKQRLMTASFDYYALRYPHEGLKGGFDYDTVPHITLKSIANNPDIDTVYDEDHPKIAAALADLNASLQSTECNAMRVNSGARKGQEVEFTASADVLDTIKTTETTEAWKLLLGEVTGSMPEDFPDEAAVFWQKANDDQAALDKLNTLLRGKKLSFTTTKGWLPGREVKFDASENTKHFRVVDTKVPRNAMLTWEVPFDWPEDWPEAARTPFDAFHTARQAMQRRMDQSIADHAEQETLYDKPRIDKSKLRICGPFSVEAVPAPTVLSLDESMPPQEADESVARSGETSR